VLMANITTNVDISLIPMQGTMSGALKAIMIGMSINVNMINCNVMMRH
jgi:hypothetical protein